MQRYGLFEGAIIDGAPSFWIDFYFLFSCLLPCKMVSSSTLLLILGPILGATRCLAFVPPVQHLSIAKSIPCKAKYQPLSAENGDGSDGLDSLLSPLPSPNVVKDNIMEVRGFC